MSTGKLLWHTQMHSPNIGPDGVSVAGGKVYGATNSNAFALSATTGEQLWSKKLIRNKAEGIDMAPAINNGTVYVSTVPGNGVTGFYTGDGVAVLWAMNAATGKTKWKWNEVPYSLWGNKKVNSGGGQWEPPTFDPQGHLYLEVANPAPFVGDKSYPGKKIYPNGSSRPGPNLYTDSVVELNPANGKMVWHYQLTPHDIHDWDLNNQALISTVNGKEAIISAGKAGIAIANDAQTGKLLWKTKVGEHNGPDDDGLLTEYSPTGHGKVKEPPYVTLPGEYGGVESPNASDGTTSYFAVNNFGVLSKTQATNGPTNFNKGTGVMVAIDQDTGKIKWQHHFTHSPFGAATVSNDLVWTTTYDGTIWALNKSTGAVVWHMKLPAGTNAPLRDRRRHGHHRRRVPPGSEPECDVHRLPDWCNGQEFGHGRVHQEELFELEQRDRGQPHGRDEGVLQHLRLLPHARRQPALPAPSARTSTSSSPPTQWLSNRSLTVAGECRPSAARCPRPRSRRSPSTSPRSRERRRASPARAVAAGHDQVVTVGFLPPMRRSGPAS